MAAVSRVLVVGTGSAGLTASILLAEAGVAVDLVEIQPELAPLGSGITLQGNALRVLHRLGVLEQCAEAGYAAAGLVIRAADPAATVLSSVEERTGGSGVPASMGMYRPDLARILMARADEVGVTTRFATTIAALEQDPAGVDVRFSDGSTGRYDVVIGADGVRSSTRHLLDVALATRSLGVGAWRMFAPRPVDVVASQMFVGGPAYIAGITPTSESTAYWFLLEPAQDRAAQSPDDLLEAFRELSRGYHGPWDEVRDSFTDPEALHYTWFEAHLLDPPWNRGRVVLIGDAVHVCPPTIAQGAAAAFEDAAVLAELLVDADVVDDTLWTSFTARRYERVKAVVEASVQLAQWYLDGVQGDMPGVMGRIAALVSQPA